jgi:hypothetical protein
VARHPRSTGIRRPFEAEPIHRSAQRRRETPSAPVLSLPQGKIERRGNHTDRGARSFQGRADVGCTHLWLADRSRRKARGATSGSSNESSHAVSTHCVPAELPVIGLP